MTKGREATASLPFVHSENICETEITHSEGIVALFAREIIIKEKCNMTGSFEQFSAKTGFFYLPDVLKHFFKVKNFLALVYLVLNYGLTFLFFYALDESIEQGLLGAAIVFLTSTFFALSPIGEAIIRLIQGFRKIEEGKKSLNKLNPIFFEVVSRARDLYPDFYLDKHLKFYLKDDPRPNAYTIGRRTLCVTTGLLNCTDEHIRAVLAHEVYHLIHHETDLILLISAGNAFLTTSALFIKFALSVACQFVHH